MTAPISRADCDALLADADKGTPGPWVCHFGDNATTCNCKYVLGDYGGMGSIATIDACKTMNGDWGDDNGPPETDAKTNARRIARVPEYEATIRALRDALDAKEAEIAAAYERGFLDGSHKE